MQKILPNPSNATLDELFVSMHSSPTKKGCLRIQAIFWLFQGQPKSLVAKATLTTERNQNRWIQRFNEAGIDGLIDKPRPGRPSLLDSTTKEKITELLDDPCQGGVSHWTIRQLHGYLKKEINIHCSYQTLVRTVHKKGYVHRFPRPQPVQQDEQKRKRYLDQLEKWRLSGYEIWYIDETGIEGDPRPRRRWVKKGSSPTVDYAGTHLRETVIGGVCPQTGELCALQMPWCNTDIFQIFLDTLAEKIKGRKVLLICGNATWHRAKRLNWHGMKHEFLPPYSPDFNPIERLWLIMKAQYFTDWVATNPEQLTDRITEALNHLINAKDKVTSICKT